MREQLTNPGREPRRENLQYFQSSNNMFSIDEHVARGITPTNNFKRFFIFDSAQYDTNGRPSLDDYRTYPQWGYIMQGLRDDKPELWEACRSTSLAFQNAMNEHVERMMSGESEPDGAAAAREAAYWAMAETLDEFFMDMVPHLEDPAVGVDPLDLCK